MQPVASALVDPGPIVKRDQEGRHDARSANPCREVCGVLAPVDQPRLPERRLVGGNGPRGPRCCQHRVATAGADFLQRLHQRQLALDLAGPLAKFRRAAVAKTALRPLEAVRASPHACRCSASTTSWKSASTIRESTLRFTSTDTTTATSPFKSRIPLTRDAASERCAWST